MYIWRAKNTYLLTYLLTNTYLLSQSLHDTLYTVPWVMLCSFLFSICFCFNTFFSDLLFVWTTFTLYFLLNFAIFSEIPFSYGKYKFIQFSSSLLASLFTFSLSEFLIVLSFFLGGEPFTYCRFTYLYLSKENSKKLWQ